MVGSMDAFRDELEKIALVDKALKLLNKGKDFAIKGKDFAIKHKKPLGIAGLLGGGYAAGKGVEQAGKDYMLGRRVRKQYEDQGE